MAKILDNFALTGSVQKFVETMEGYIVNGHYYDKQDLIPKPFKLFPTYGNNTDISMNQKMTLNHNFAYHGKSSGDTIVVDRYDPTISYIWTINTRGNFCNLLKIKENNGEVSTIATTSYSAIPTTYPFPRAYCGQDANFIYYLMACTTYHDYFVKIDKVSLTMTVITDEAVNCWSTPLYENTTYIYYAKKQGYATNFIKRYNKTTGVTDSFTISAKTTNIYFSTCFAKPIMTSDTSFVTFSVFHNLSTNKFGITKYTVDTTQAALANVVTEVDVPITWGSTITQLPVLASAITTKYEPFITTVDGKQYLNIAIYENSNASTVANIPSNGIYTFLLDISANTLTYKSFMQPTTDYFRGFLGARENSFLVGASPSTCIFMNFNKTTETFEITDSLTNQPYHIGIDQAENIWIIDSTTQVEYLNPFVPTNINVTAEKLTQKYEGVDIPTYLTVSAQNYSGVFIQSKIQLTIKGSAVFTATNSKVLTIDTSTTGSIQVPMKIQDKGGIIINTSLIM